MLRGATTKSTWRLPQREQVSRLGPLGHREIGTVTLGLLAGVEIDLVAAILAPDAQQEMRPGRGAERRPVPIRLRGCIVAYSEYAA